LVDSFNKVCLKLELLLTPCTLAASPDNFAHNAPTPLSFRSNQAISWDNIARNMFPLTRFVNFSPAIAKKYICTNTITINLGAQITRVNLLTWKKVATPVVMPIITK
jgi:hypothetical protein